MLLMHRNLWISTNQHVTLVDNLLISTFLLNIMDTVLSTFD
jgi:hypothetical protein